MEYIKWNEGLSVDNEMIDNQHKELFRLIDDFYHGIASKKGKKAMVQVIDRLEKYMHEHFNFEEFKMKMANYPELDAHMKEHKEFIEEGRLLLSLEITSFVKEWITNHIQISDKKYVGVI